MCDDNKNNKFNDDKNSKNDKGDEDMSKVFEIKPFEINFESDREREDFVKWANVKSEKNTHNKREMISEMKRIRAIRKRGKN